MGPTISKCTPLTGNHRHSPPPCVTPLLRTTPNSPSHPRDDPARERLGHAPLLVDADGEHQLLKSLTLELADCSTSAIHEDYFEYHWYEHPEIGRREIKRKQMKRS